MSLTVLFVREVRLNFGPPSLPTPRARAASVCLFGRCAIRQVREHPRFVWWSPRDGTHALVEPVQTGIGSTEHRSPLIDQRTVRHAGVGTGLGLVMASAAVSVLTWLSLSYIAWCIHTGNGKHLFRQRDFCLKWCAGMGGWPVLSHSLEDAGPEHDYSADKDERNGRCEQATSPDADPSHFHLNPAPGGSAIFSTVLG